MDLFNCMTKDKIVNIYWHPFHKNAVSNLLSERVGKKIYKISDHIYMAKAVLICFCKGTTLGKATAIKSITRVSLQKSIVISQDQPDFCRSHMGELSGQSMGITIPILFAYFIATAIPYFLKYCLDVWMWHSRHFPLYNSWNSQGTEAM